MPLNTNNIKMGTCYVWFKGNNLGATLGGVEVEISTSTKEIMIDQTGETAVSEYIMGRSITVKVPMAETTIENMNLIMPGSDLVNTNSAVEVKSGTGINLLETAGELILRPVDKVEDGTPGDPTDDDQSEDLVIYKANTPGAAQFAYKYNEERVLIAEFKGYVDADNNNRLFAYGDLGATHTYTPALNP